MDPRKQLLDRLAMAAASGLPAGFGLLADVGARNAEHPDDTLTWDEAKAVAAARYGGT